MFTFNELRLSIYRTMFHGLSSLEFSYHKRKQNPASYTASRKLKPRSTIFATRHDSESDKPNYFRL